MSVEEPSRRGLNAPEAAIAWAYARFGGKLEATQVLAADAAGDVGRAVESLEALDEDERDTLVERWRRQDRRWTNLEGLAQRVGASSLRSERAAMSPRWQRALDLLTGDRRSERPPWHDKRVRIRRAIVALVVDPLREHVTPERPELQGRTGFDPACLLEMEPQQRERFIRRLGVFQLAALADDQDRRQIARLRRSLPAQDRDWFDECMRRDRPIEGRERSRLREVFLAASRQEPDLGGRMIHLGVYSIAAAAGMRFGNRLERVAERLSGALRALLSHYHLLDAEAGLPTLEAAFRRGLDEYAARTREPGFAPDSPETRGRP